MDNNIQGRIDDYLDQTFGPYEDNPAVADLRIEVRHDLLERLADLTGRGAGDEVAYAQVIASVGDIGATIRELVVRSQGYEVAEAASPQEPVIPAHADDMPSAEPAIPPQADDMPSAAVPPFAQMAADIGLSCIEPVVPMHEPDGPADPGWDSPASAPGTRYEPTESVRPEHEAEAAGAPPGGNDDPSEKGSAPGGDDWFANLTSMIGATMETARSQIVDALQQADQALASNDWEERLKDSLERNLGWVRGADEKARISFSASTLRDTDFSGRDMPNSKFTACSMRGSVFVGATLAGSNFNSSDLRGVDFSGADLTGARLETCSLRGARFERTNLTRARLGCASLREIAFVGVTLSGARAEFADLRGARFADCAMDQVNLKGADLRGAIFDGLVLSDVKFDMANVSGMSLRGTTLRRTSFKHVSQRAVRSMILEDTVMDQQTYLSLRATGFVPQNVRIED